MKRFLIATSLFFSLAFSVNAQNVAQKYIDTELKTDSLFTNAVVGIMAVNGDGKVIAEWNSNHPMLTASTLKTVTTGVGLVTLGADFKFTTKIAYSGTITDTVLHGNIYIIGGADPTLGSRDDVAYDIDSIFGIWTDAIKSLGIKKIDGNIVADDSYFDRELMPDSWSWSNFGASYGSAPSGLTFYENGQDFKLTPGKAVGDSVKIEEIYPHIPGLNVINELKTGNPRTGDRSMYYVQDMAKVSLFTGTVGVDRAPVISYNSSRFPHLSCGYHFREYLSGKGIESNPEILDIKELPKSDDMVINYITETYSPELWEIINVTNHISNNLYAETILKTIGKEKTGAGRYDSSIIALNRALKELGVDTYGFTMEDGSGLSRQNYVSPKFFCNYYTMMSENDNFVKFLESFPVPGGEGTLKGVLKNEEPALKSRIHAKSGSLSNVRCYAGYVEGGKKNGLIKFAILVNNYSAPTSKMQPKIEGFLRALALEK